eukprot:3475949-Pyramimonas_sp.AAC.1
MGQITWFSAVRCAHGHGDGFGGVPGSGVGRRDPDEGVSTDQHPGGRAQAAGSLKPPPCDLRVRAVQLNNTARRKNTF